MVNQDVAIIPIHGIGLCSGAGGLELGLEIALPGYRTVAMVEREIGVLGRVAARIEEGSLPPLVAWSDVSTFDGHPFRGRVDIVSAGFPCQPFSLAGKRAGTDDARWIWPDIARIIGEVEPELCFLENVPGLLLDPDSDSDPFGDLGESTNDALGGMATVLGSLASLGFDAEWCCVRASDVGASHGRNRVFILAYRNVDWRKSARSTERPVPGSNGQGDGGVRSGGHLADSEDDQRGRGVSGAETGIGEDDQRGRGSASGDGAVAKPPGAGLSIGGNGLGLRKPPAFERGGGEVGDAAGRGLGELREPSGGVRLTDGADEALARAARPGGEGQAGEDGRVWWRGVREASHELPGFAPGPKDERWPHLLVRFPWMRPSISQAEIESYLRDVADGLASLVVNERTGALRALGNGVVPLQAAFGFILLARRAGLCGL